MITLQEIKDILDNLNSALGLMVRKISDVEKIAEEQKITELKWEEKQSELKDKENSLTSRELKVAEIESIADFSNKAKNLMAEAKELMKNADDRQEKLEKGLKKLAEDRMKLEKEYQDKEVAQKNQAEALRKERDEFNGKIKAFKSVSAALK